MTECQIYFDYTQEAELPKEDFNREPFAELHSIWESIQNKNITPALDWASKYSQELMAKNSTLEFKLHRLAYMQVGGCLTMS